MSGGNSRSASATRRPPRNTSPIIPFADEQADAQARAVLARESKKAAKQQEGEGGGLAQSGSQNPSQTPSQNPQAIETSDFDFPSESVSLAFVADAMRKGGPSLTADALFEQFHAHFNLHEVGTTREELLPHVLNLQDKVSRSAVPPAPRHVKFAFGPEPSAQASKAPKPQQQHQQRQQQPVTDPTHRELQDFVAAFRPDLSEGKSTSGLEQKAPSLRSSSGGGARDFSSPYSTHAQLLGASLHEEEEDDDDDHEDPFYDERRARTRVNVLRSPLATHLYASILTKGHRGAQAFVKEACKDFPARTFKEMEALGAAADYIANGRHKDALEVIMRRFHGLNVATLSPDPVKAWKAFETLQHPALSSSILPEDVEFAMARALKRSANGLFSSRSSTNYTGSSGAAAPESGGGSKRG